MMATTSSAVHHTLRQRQRGQRDEDEAQGQEKGQQRQELPAGDRQILRTAPAGHHIAPGNHDGEHHGD
jgi:hypothetical protein